MKQILFLNTDLKISLKNILDIEKPNNIFLVCGNNSFESSGAKSMCEIVLEKYNVIIFDQFSSNPKSLEVERGMKMYKKQTIDLVIAIGGGSALDVAKSINIICAQDVLNVTDFDSKKVNKRGVPLVAVPTTAGSGSEATKFTVFYRGKSKISLEHEYIIPNYVIIDPKLTFSLPKKITAVTGLDALCQAIESFWSINSNEESKKYSRKAISLILPNIEKVVSNPSIELRTKMIEGSYYAGKAINITKTTASHAMSYALTSMFNIPHGHAVGITISELIVFNNDVTDNDVNDKRGTHYVKGNISELVKILGCLNTKEASNKIKRILNNLNLETNLSSLGITLKDIDRLVDHLSVERAGNNPRKFSKDSAKVIFNAII